MPAFLRRHPEVVLVCLCGVVLGVGAVSGLPIAYPEGDFVSPFLGHYLLPLALAAGFKILVLMYGEIFHKNKRTSEPYLMIKLMPVVLLVVFCHFNFKAWMPIVNTRIYDYEYYSIDRALAPIVNFFIQIRTAVAGLFPFSVDFGYHGLFILMFVASLSAHALLDDEGGQRRLVFGICAVLAVGGISYWVAPAVGPFIYRDGVNQLSHRAQQQMFLSYQQVRATGALPSGYFIYPLAAMPSLHIAHTVFLTIMISRISRVLFAAYLLIGSWIIIESVASAWHYVVDLPAGILVTALVLLLQRPFDWQAERKEEAKLLASSAQ